MNNISFGNGEGQKQGIGSSLTSSLISTGVTTGVGALGGAGLAKVASLAPVSKPTTEKIIEELYTSGDSFVKGSVDTLEKINKANLCDTFILEMDDALETIATSGGRKGLFGKTNPAQATQEYLRGIMDVIGEKVDDSVELTKEQVKTAIKNKRATLTTESREKFGEIIETTRKGLFEKAEDFLKTHKKGDELFDSAVKATKKMKNDIRVASFAKWGAIIALGLSVIGNFIPARKRKETTQA
jgi:hypothetical protein